MGDRYVGVVKDAILFGKNIGILRNFDKLQDVMKHAKAAASKNKTRWTVDIWPLVVQPGSAGQCSYEMLLQLANIVKQVHRYEKTVTLRLMHFVEKVQ